ncbi:hypothetical protein VPH35_135981 [Triticum aestivum]
MEPIQTCCLLSWLELHVGYFIWTPICRGQILCSVQIQSTGYKTCRKLITCSPIPQRGITTWVPSSLKRQTSKSGRYFRNDEVDVQQEAQGVLMGHIKICELAGTGQ